MAIDDPHDSEAARIKREIQRLEARLADLEHETTTERIANLARTRAYAHSATADHEDVVAHGIDALRRYGFCVVDDVIPPDEVAAVRAEVDAAEPIISGNHARIRELMSRGVDLNLSTPGVDLREVRHRARGPKPPNDIVWMPKYAEWLAHPVVVDIAKRMLDDHLKIAQLHLRPIAETQADGTPGGFGSPKHRGRADTRSWHTDWPHDLSAYGSDDPELNVGCIRQPFPDVPMCVVMIWYLSDVTEDAGGTWVVPGSHRDPRNPRGPEDGICVTSPVPGDMQVTAKAGSVFIQDSRTWHASPMHNFGRKRTAVVNRWCPWWLSVNDYAPGGTLDTLCRPLSQAEYRALPEALKPLMRHLCPDERDALHPAVLKRARAAEERSRWGLRQLAERPDEIADLNAHVRVELPD